MSFDFRTLVISDLIVIEPQVFEDERGFFMETYRRSEFEARGIPQPFVQDNCSYSRGGVLRGLHYQKPPKTQGKLVAAVQGEIFDVAVDIRQGSPTYGRWFGVNLSDRNRRMLYVPPGFAHGFCALSEQAYVLYKATAEYAPESESGIRWNDPTLGIDWPLSKPVVSARDARLPWLDEVAPLQL